MNSLQLKTQSLYQPVFRPTVTQLSSWHKLIQLVIIIPSLFFFQIYSKSLLILNPIIYGVDEFNNTKYKKLHVNVEFYIFFKLISWYIKKKTYHMSINSRQSIFCIFYQKVKRKPESSSLLGNRRFLENALFNYSQ